MLQQTRSAVDRTRVRFAARHEDGESGSLILDILIGMAIFALVAIIAVTAIGQYRMRAYIQAAMSDAEAMALAINAAITDKAGDPAADAYPTGLLTDAEMRALEVTPTSSGSQKSAVTVIPGTVNPETFSVCVTYRGAYAEYESEEGLTASGSIAEDGFAGCDATLPDDDDDDDDDGNTTPGLLAPTDVTATAVPGEQRATVEWDAVTGATSYAVYLDGATTPEYTGGDLTTVLTGLDNGEHSVTVTATGGGQTSEPSAPATFTISCSNDNLRCAHVVQVADPGSTWTTEDYNNATGTNETGEPATQYANNGYWWTLRAPRDGTYTFRMANTSTGTSSFNRASIHVWRSTTRDVTALGATPEAGNTISNNWVIPVSMREGETIKVRIGAYGGSSYPGGLFRLQVGFSPDNDFLAHAIEIPSVPAGDVWHSADSNNFYGGNEPGEPALTNADSGLWWTLTAPRDGTYTFRMANLESTGASSFNRASIHVWKTTTTDVTTLGAPLSGNTVSNNWVIPVSAREGQTIKVRIGAYGPAGNTSYPPGAFRFQVGFSPDNDFLAHATEVTGLTPGDVWHSADTNNFYAGSEPNEPATASAINGVWWTLTAPQDGTYTFRPVATTTGAGPIQYPAIHVWRSNSTDVSALGAPVASRTAVNNWVVPVSARRGETIKVRIGAYDLSTRPPGRFRLQVGMSPDNDFLARAAEIAPPTISTPSYSADANNFYAGSEENEPFTANHINGLWWTMTARNAGTYTVRVAATSTGAGPHQYPGMAVWKTTATSVSALDATPLASRQATNNQNIPVTLAAGETVKIRIGAYDMNTRPPGPFRLMITTTDASGSVTAPP